MKLLVKTLLAGLAALCICNSALAAKTPAQICELGWTKAADTQTKLINKGLRRGCIRGPDPAYDAKLQAKMDKKAIRIGQKVASKSNNYANCDPDDNYPGYFIAGYWDIGTPTVSIGPRCDGS